MDTYPREDGSKAAGQTERNSKDDVASVIEMSRQSPPATHEQLTTNSNWWLSPNGFARVVFKVVLLLVAPTEDGVPQEERGNHALRTEVQQQSTNKWQVREPYPTICQAES